MKRTFFILITLILFPIFILKVGATEKDDFSFELKNVLTLENNTYRFDLEYINLSDKNGSYHLDYVVQTINGIHLDNDVLVLNDRGEISILAKGDKLSPEIISLTFYLSENLNESDTPAEINVDISKYQQSISKPEERVYKTEGSNYLAFLIPLSVIAVIGVATTFAILEYKKKKLFTDSYEKCVIGTSLDDVKKFMADFELVNEFYNKEGEKILKYKLKNDIEIVTFIFLDDNLIKKISWKE